MAMDMSLLLYTIGTVLGIVLAIMHSHTEARKYEKERKKFKKT